MLSSLPLSQKLGILIVDFIKGGEPAFCTII